MKKLGEALRKDFPPEALSKDTSRGFELTSIKAMYVIERLNDVFGITGWCYEWVEMEFRDGEWTCVVELRVFIGDDVRVVRQYGGKRVVKTNHTDAKKSAVTDGLTKCASMLGIGHSVFKGQQMAGDPPKTPDPTASQPEKGDVTDAQRKKIYAMSNSIGFEEKEMKEMMKVRYKVDSSKELSKKQASDFIEHLSIIEKQNEPPEDDGLPF